MWLFPFLYYYHKYPITTFYQEWWSALLGVLALAGWFARDGWREAKIPRIVQLPVALIAVVLLQMALGMMTYTGQGLLYILYLLFAALMMMLGARLRDYFGIAKLAVVLSVVLLIGAELSTLVGVLQHYHWHTPLDTVLARKLTPSVYGNLGQANHFADYLALGLVSLGLLLQQCGLRKPYVALLALPLLFAMTLSGSRSTWLYLLMMFVLSWWAGRGKPELCPLRYYSLLLLSGYVGMHFLVQLPFMAEADSINILQRFAGADALGGIRLSLWHEVWLMFTSAPWLGAGFGQFAWQHFQYGPLLRQTNIPGFFNNAHNLIFQLAAETGIAGLAALFAALGVWLYGLRRATLSAAHWWGYAALGVLAIHSLLEYPLWYAYFLAVVAILLGAMDETRYRLAMPNAGCTGLFRLGMAGVLLMGLLSLFQLRSVYRQLEETVASHDAGSGSVAESAQSLRENLRQVQRMPLLSPYAELFLGTYIKVGDQGVKENLALNSRVVRYFPIEEVVYRQAMLLAQNGQQAQAQQVWWQAVWAYPLALEQRNRLQSLAEKDPAHFAALLEFALQKEQEYARAVYYQ